jgi:hypothetical protein
MFCPRCNCEYRPAFTECADCRVALAPAPDPAAVRAEVERAGQATALVRFVCGTVVLAPVGLLLYTAVAADPTPDFHVDRNLMILTILGISAALLCLFVLPVTWANRWLRQQALRSRVAALPREVRNDLLLSLRDNSCRDTRSIARSLGRDLGMAREMTPAPSPAGRGDEPVSADT